MKSFLGCHKVLINIRKCEIWRKITWRQNLRIKFSDENTNLEVNSSQIEVQFCTQFIQCFLSSYRFCNRDKKGLMIPLTKVRILQPNPSLKIGTANAICWIFLQIESWIFQHLFRAKLCNQVRSLSLFRWRTLTLLNI